MAESLMAWNSRRSPQARVTSQTWDWQPLILCSSVFSASGNGRQLAAEVDDVLVAVDPVVEQGELLHEFALTIGNGRLVHRQPAVRRQRVPSGPSRMTMPAGHEFVPDAVGRDKVLVLPGRQPPGEQLLDGFGGQAVSLAALEPGIRIGAEQTEQVATGPQTGRQAPGARRGLRNG